MVKTRSQDGDSKGKELDVEDPMDSRLSRLEDMIAERGKMIKQLADMVEAFSRSTAGKIEFPKSIDKMASQLQLQEELQSSNVLLEEKSKPEAQEENPKLENHEGWEQMVTLEVEGDVEKGQEVQSMEKNCTAHQVFDKMSLGVQSKRRQIKCHKSWRFKFKQRKQQRGKPRSAHKLIYKGILMIDSEDHLSSSMVKEIGIEISSDRWLSNSIGCESETGETVNDEYRVPSDSDLIMNDIEKDKERLKGKKRRKSLKSWRFKFKIQVFSDFDFASWIGLEIYGCETKKQTLLVVKLANHVWKPGGFVHPKIQLDWLGRADSNHEKESNKKLRKLKLHQGRKSHKAWMFKYKSEFPRHYGFDSEALFGVEFYELEYKKLYINHCFAVQEFYGIHGSISGPWHLAFDPGGIISCTACDDFVVTHTQWVGHDKLEGCSNDQNLATYVAVEEKQAWIENAWFKIQSMLVQKRVLLQADETIIKTDLCQLHQLQDTTVSNWAPDCVKQLQQSGNPLFQKVHETLWLTLPIPPTNQMKNVHTQIHMVQWAWRCVKHDTQQTDFHVWHRWKNKAEKLEVSLVCSGKRWSFVVYAFYDHTVVLRKEPILSPKIKRGFENKIIAGMPRGQSVKQHHGGDSENAKLHINSIKRHYTGLVGIMVLQILSFRSLQNLEVKVSSKEGDVIQKTRVLARVESRKNRSRIRNVHVASEE